MTSTKAFKAKNVKGIVTANAEILFMDGGSVHGWTRRFSNRIQEFTAEAAPTNKRPRWGHYGKPLKATIVSNPPRFRKAGSGARVYASVGSTSAHALFVDQGTGVYGGSGPYEAKILPPWHHGEASLYESTWRPAGPDTKRVAKVFIKGQKPQQFFAAGLKRAFAAMRMRSFQVPGDPKVGDVLRTWPRELENFVGGTQDGVGFRLSLAEWRMWRDEAWGEFRGLGRGGGLASRAHAQFIREERKIRQADPNFQKFLASKAASERRAAEQRAAIREQNRRKKEGQRKQREKEAAIALESAKRRTRNAAVAFGKKKVKQGATSLSGSWVTDSSGRLLFRLTWITKKGEVKHRFFKVGK